MENRRAKGFATALDNRPELDEVTIGLWNMYCFIGEDILSSLHIYSFRIGLPYGWDFEDSLTLLQKLRISTMEKPSV